LPGKTSREKETCHANEFCRSDCIQLSIFPSNSDLVRSIQRQPQKLALAPGADMKVLTCTLMRAAAHITSLIVILLGAADSAAAQQPSQAQTSAIRSACRTGWHRRLVLSPGEGGELFAALPAGCTRRDGWKTNWEGPCSTTGRRTSGSDACTALGRPRRHAARSTFLAAHRVRRRLPHLLPRVGLGGGRAIGCLEAQAASLSPNCQSALDALGR